MSARRRRDLAPDWRIQSVFWCETASNTGGLGFFLVSEASSGRFLGFLFLCVGVGLLLRAPR
jgi:hypothetical protein